jgi:hypothetical protein
MIFNEQIPYNAISKKITAIVNVALECFSKKLVLF